MSRHDWTNTYRRTYQDDRWHHTHAQEQRIIPYWKKPPLTAEERECRRWLNRGLLLTVVVIGLIALAQTPWISGRPSRAEREAFKQFLIERARHHNTYRTLEELEAAQTDSVLPIFP